MPRKISEKEIESLVTDFRSGILLENLVKSYGFTKATINKYLKKNINDKEYKTLIHKQISKNQIAIKSFSETNQEINKFKSGFYELEPLDFDIDESSRKDFSSIPLNKIDFPPMVYMIVDKNIELRIKLLREYASWQFLPEEDLNRKTIEVFFDIKVAKTNCSKDQKVIKVPNTNVFKIVAPILIARGISRIVSAEQLITI